MSSKRSGAADAVFAADDRSVVAVIFAVGVIFAHARRAAGAAAVTIAGIGTIVVITIAGGAAGTGRVGTDVIGVATGSAPRLRAASRH